MNEEINELTLNFIKIRNKIRVIRTDLALFPNFILTDSEPSTNMVALSEIRPHMNHKPWPRHSASSEISRTPKFENIHINQPNCTPTVNHRPFPYHGSSIMLTHTWCGTKNHKTLNDTLLSNGALESLDQITLLLPSAQASNYYDYFSTPQSSTSLRGRSPSRLNQHYQSPSDFVLSPPYEDKIAQNLYTHTRSLDSKLKIYPFDSSDPIRTLSFLQRFSLAFDTTRGHEGASLCRLPQFLRGFARDNIQLRLWIGAQGSSDRSPSWSNYFLVWENLLRTFASNDILSAKQSDVTTYPQGKKEKPVFTGLRLNARTSDEVMYLFIPERVIYIF